MMDVNDGIYNVGDGLGIMCFIRFLSIIMIFSATLTISLRSILSSRLT